MSICIQKMQGILKADFIYHHTLWHQAKLQTRKKMFVTRTLEMHLFHFNFLVMKNVSNGILSVSFFYSIVDGFYLIISPVYNSIFFHEFAFFFFVIICPMNRHRDTLEPSS
jgi:hypothetical protein